MALVIVIKPVKKPPKFDKRQHLSFAAQETLRALEEKYSATPFVDPISSLHNILAVVKKKHDDPADYYKHIYNKTFKTEIESQTGVISGFETSFASIQDRQRDVGHESRSVFCAVDRDYREKCEAPHTTYRAADVLSTYNAIKEISIKNQSSFFCHTQESPMIDLDFQDSQNKGIVDNEWQNILSGKEVHMKPLFGTNDKQSMNFGYELDEPFNQPYNSTKQSNDRKILKKMKWKRKFEVIASQSKDKEVNVRSKKFPKDSPQTFSSHFDKNSLMDFDTDCETIWFEDESESSHKPVRTECTIDAMTITNLNQTENTPSHSKIPSNEYFVKNNFSPVEVHERESLNMKVLPASPLYSTDGECESGNENLKHSDQKNNYQIKMYSESPFGLDETTPLVSSPLLKGAEMSELPTHSKESFVKSKVKGSVQKKKRLGGCKEYKEKVPTVSRMDRSHLQAEAIKSSSKTKSSCKSKHSKVEMKEDPLLDTSESEKLRKPVLNEENENNVQKPMKKIKLGFKPPTKQTSLLHYIDATCKDNDGSKGLKATSSHEANSELPKIIEFFSLTSDRQQNIVNEINYNQQIVLTIVFSNGQTLTNQFFPSGDIPKEPSSIIILTADSKCYQLTVKSASSDIVKNILMQILSSKECETIITNSKHFLSYMYRMLQIDTDLMIHCEKCDDPVLASWLLNPDKTPKSFSMMCQTASLQFNGAETDWLQCLCFTRKLMSSLKKCLEKENLIKLYNNIEMKLVPLLSYMENQSLIVDIEVFRNFADILKIKIHKLEECAFKEVGHKFSMNSHCQLRQILFEELKLDEKLPSTSKIGKTHLSHLKSTCESSLLLLVGLHPLPSIILEHRSLQKLKSTYINGMLSCVTTNSISTHWDQTSAATGRLTSYQPNVQNIPKTVVVVEDYLPNSVLGAAPKSSANINAREPFICHEGFVFLAADFQQIELRILAHLSDDKQLLSVFWNPTSLDIFSLLSAEWKKIPVGTVSNEERETTKRIVYSVMYGVGKEKLAEYLKIKPEEAKEIMQNFLARFPAIGSFTKKCCSYAKEYGYTETICGRRRYFPYINSPSPALRSQAQRQAVNFCVQGSAADICKLAMLEVESSLAEHPELTCRLLLQIHDELLWEVTENQVLKVKEIIQNIMGNGKALCQDFCSLQVPLSVSFSQGKSWAHLCPANERTSMSVSDMGE